MKINDLMRLIASHYDDAGTDAFWDYENEKMDCEGTGDTLAEFIVREIYYTFEPEASDLEQLEEAERAMRSAERQLHDVVRALGRAQHALQVPDGQSPAAP